MLIVALLLALLVGVSLGLLGGGGSLPTLSISSHALGMEGHAGGRRRSLRDGFERK